MTTQIKDDHTVEKPMIHTAGDSLNYPVVNIKDIKRSNTPGVIVTVLPVIHTVLPPVSIIAPPFARDIAMLQSPICSANRIGMATLVKDSFGSQSEVECPAKRHPTNDE